MLRDSNSKNSGDGWGQFGWKAYSIVRAPLLGDANLITSGRRAEPNLFTLTAEIEE